VKQKHDNGFPSRDAIVAFIRANPGKVGTRDIAREFGLKNADRAELKRILRDLADQGAIQKQGKKVVEAAELPATLLADITRRDADGELIATPAEWDEEQGDPPKIRIHIPRHARPGTMAGVGDRALLRVERLADDDGASYRGRVIKVIDHAKSRVLGVFRSTPDGNGRLIPVDKKRAESSTSPGPTPAAHRMAISSASISCVRAASASPPAR
jgi:ribonuclease R